MFTKAFHWTLFLQCLVTEFCEHRNELLGSIKLDISEGKPVRMNYLTFVNTREQKD
jgi:hypothetical protein